MVERNPYENHTPVDVPSFMKEDKEEKEKVNMNIFKLKDDEIEDDDYEEEDDETESYRTHRAGSSSTYLVVIAIVCFLIAAVLGILVVSKSNAYKTLNEEHQAYVTSSEKQTKRLESQIETLTKENETLKAENETLKTSASSSSSSSSSSSGKDSGTSTSGTATSFKAGTYKVAVSVYVRDGVNGNIVKQSNMPTAIQYITYDNSTVVEGSDVKVSEVKTSGDQVWGKIGDGCWICLKNGNNVYVD